METEDRQGAKRKKREHFNLPLILLITTVELVSITGRQSTSSGEWVTGGNTSQGYLEHSLKKMDGRVEGL